MASDTTHDDPTDAPDPQEIAAKAASAIASATGAIRHDVAVIMGSGWAPAAERFGTPAAELQIGDLPGFTAPSVAGHSGRALSIPVDSKRVLALLGRTHYYEGRGVATVAHGVRTAVAAGAKLIILTNAAGGLKPEYVPGQPVLISDHLNLTATSPIVGPTFIDLTDLYSARLRAVAREIDPTLAEGVYAQLPGPHYETPAEIRMLRGLGADLVGMSTVLEAIAARAAGAEVFGLSMVTNLAAGMTGEPLDHAEVLAAGKASAEKMGALLAELVKRA